MLQPNTISRASARLKQTAKVGHKQDQVISAFHTCAHKAKVLKSSHLPKTREYLYRCTHMSQSPQTSVLRFQFPEFEAHKGSVLAESSATDINGDIWKLMINISEPKCYRRGNSSNWNHNLISMNFVLMREVTSSVNTDDIKFSFVVRDAKGNVAHEEEFVPSGSPDDTSNLMRLFNLKGANASDNGSVLLDGTLVIDIVVQALPKSSATHTLFNPFQRNMLNLFYSGERSDITFEFGHFKQYTIRAHKFILETNAPALAKLCESDNISATVHIRDMSVDAFRFVLKYIYGGPPPNPKDVLKYGKDIIEAAHRYGISGLKLEIERSFVELRVVDTSNCIDFICFAQENSCSLLKKQAISYFVARSGDILNVSDSAQRLKDSPDLMLEILCAIMKIKPDDMTSPPTKPKSKKWKGLLSRRRSSCGKKKKKGGKGRVVPAQPGLQKKVNANHIAGLELLGTDTVRKEAIKILQLCEEPRRK